MHGPRADFKRHTGGLPAKTLAMTLCTVLTPRGLTPFRARVISRRRRRDRDCSHRRFHLSGRAHVLVAFFRLAFTSTCTAENCAFSEDCDAFERAGTTVLPVSVDSAPTLREYKTKYAMRQELLSDFRREVCRAYGVLLEDRFYSKRAYFLVGRQGTLRWSHIEAELGARREDTDLLRQIATL